MDLELEREGRRLSRKCGRPSSIMAVAASLAAILGGDESAWGPRGSTVKPQDRGTCGLSGCDKPANRGGYCCAEHCHEARDLDRKARGFS